MGIEYPNSLNALGLLPMGVADNQSVERQALGKTLGKTWGKTWGKTVQRVVRSTGSKTLGDPLGQDTAL
jgi:hypothetical protein